MERNQFILPEERGRKVQSGGGREEELSVKEEHSNAHADKPQSNSTN
jgi:hypothetical protein